MVVAWDTPRRRHFPTARELANLIRAARLAEEVRIHAVADGCIPHGLVYRQLYAGLRESLPNRLQADAHRRILAPASRMYARKLDAAEEPGR
jgi:hypothetical protein